MRRLPERLVTILNEVVAKYYPDWLNIRADTPPVFNAEQRFALQQACGDELCATGLTDQDEPNERGYLLEELIDWLGQGERSG